MFLYGSLLAMGLLLVETNISAGQISLTDHSPLCATFRDNAMKTFGATCWKKAVNSYLGVNQKKKHNFLKEIVEVSGGHVPFSHTDSYEAVLATWSECFEDQMEWERVTGSAQTGDIVVTNAHMGMVLELGDLSMILENGRLLSRGTPQELNIRNAVHAAYDWKVCVDNAAGITVGSINPAAPPSGCPWPWTQDTAKVNAVTNTSVLNWYVIRAAKTLIDTFYPAFPMQEQICVYRYIRKVAWVNTPPQCVCLGSGPNEIVDNPCGVTQRIEQPNVCMRTTDEKGTCIATGQEYYQIDLPYLSYIDPADFIVQANDTRCQFVAECFCAFNANGDKPVYDVAGGSIIALVRAVCYRTIGPDVTNIVVFKEIAYGASGGYMKEQDVTPMSMDICEM